MDGQRVIRKASLLVLAALCALALVAVPAAWGAEQTISDFTPAAGAELGRSVAVSGDTLVVGAPDETVGGTEFRGSVLVFQRSGGSWVLQQKLTAQDMDNTPGVDPDLFGASVALDGDTLAVGAPLGDGLGGSSGVVHVFTRIAGVWTRQQLIDPMSAGADSFGRSVALDGDTLVVGAPQNDQADPATGPGKASVWQRSTGTWSLQCSLLEPGTPANGDAFGFSVAIDDGTIAVGAPFRDVEGQADAGAVSVFTTAPAWPLQQSLQRTVAIVNQQFGFAVALDGGTLLAGVPNAASGVVDVITRLGTYWSRAATLVPSVHDASDTFGSSVALDGDLAVVGSPLHTTIKGTETGAAYLFQGSEASWTQRQILLPAAAVPHDEVGWSVDISGTTAVAGAPFHDGSGGLDDAGLASAFLLDVTGPVVTAVPSPAANAAGWWKSAPAITLTAFDAASGLSSVEYRRSGTTWLAYSAPFTVPADQGEWTWEYQATDNDANVTAGSLVVRLDSVAPSTVAYAVTARAGKNVNLPFKVGDKLPSCGKAKVVLKIYAGKAMKKKVVAGTRACNLRASQSWKCSLARGAYTIKVYATDIAGNVQGKVGSARLTVK